MVEGGEGGEARQGHLTSMSTSWSSKKACEMNCDIDGMDISLLTLCLYLYYS